METSPDNIDYIKTRIICLVAQLNGDELNKKQRREAMRELNGYGIILLRDKQERIVTLKIGTGDCAVMLKNFEINGKVETAQGIVIGYVCGNCFATSNVRDSVMMVVTDPDNAIPTCVYCSSYDIQPIYDVCIIS